MRRGTHLVDLEVGVGGDDGASTEVDSLAAEVSSETTLLSLEALAESSDRLLALWMDRASARPSGRGKKGARTMTVGTPGSSELMYVATAS